MTKRLGAILVLVILCIAGIALAEKKNATVRINDGTPCRANASVKIKSAS